MTTLARHRVRRFRRATRRLLLGRQALFSLLLGPFDTAALGLCVETEIQDHRRSTQRGVPESRSRRKERGEGEMARESVSVSRRAVLAERFASRKEKSLRGGGVGEATNDAILARPSPHL